MLNGMKLAVAILVAILIIAVFIFADAPQTDEELNKKYAPILGDYAFDVAALGMGEVTITFYVESGSVWAQTDVSSEPGELLPVEEKEFTFTLEDDDEGEYTRCHVKNESMSMDVFGDKR